MRSKLPLVLAGLLAVLAVFLLAGRLPSSVKPEPHPPPPANSPFTLKAEAINVFAPVLKEVDGYNESVYLKLLENGVAHFQGTGLPGEGRRIFIFGHSGFYKNQPGNYKEVFLELDDLKLGEVIEVSQNGQDFRYSVVENRVVEADDFSVLEDRGYEVLTLMTCWPPKTISKRRIVEALPI